MRRWKIATILLIVFVCLANLSEGKGKEDQDVSEMEKSVGGNFNVVGKEERQKVKRSADELDKIKKKKKRKGQKFSKRSTGKGRKKRVTDLQAEGGEKKINKCFMRIFHLAKRHDKIFFEAGTFWPGPQRLGIDDDCYNFKCEPKKTENGGFEVDERGRKRVIFKMNYHKAGTRLCDSCRVGDAEIAVGSVAMCKLSLPSPCFCQVCTYPDNQPFPAASPVLVKIGLNCDCAKPGGPGSGAAVSKSSGGRRLLE